MGDSSHKPIRPFVVIDGEHVEVDIRMVPLVRQHRLMARLVLNDAYRALQLLEAQNDLVDARIHYFGLMALLRAVGHVLDKVDGAEDQLVKAAAAEMFAEMKNNRCEYEIFFEFIEAERNLILKEYRSGADIRVPVPVLIRPDGSETIPESARPFPMFVFEGGPYTGEDARDVAPRAIEFWDEYLGEIERTCFGQSYAQYFESIKSRYTLSEG
jgi:hypothetical protein